MDIGAAPVWPIGEVSKKGRKDSDRLTDLSRLHVDQSVLGIVLQPLVEGMGDDEEVDLEDWISNEGGGGGKGRSIVYMQCKTHKMFKSY